MDERFDVVGIGNAIVDVLADATDEFLTARGLARGSMTLIAAEQAEALYAEMRDTVECSGGSAANTMAGLASLGGRAAYIGKVRDDALGEVFRRAIRQAGVRFDTSPAVAGPPTARSMSLGSPDGQRTMQTFLGAAAGLAPADIAPATIEGGRVTYLEGYLWDPPPAKEAFIKAAGIAHAAGRKVALSLSDAFCVDRHRREFRDLVADHVDILFANEDEIVSLFEAASFDDALGRLRGLCDVAALTRGEAGSVVLWHGTEFRIDPETVERVVDTTGAGDQFAAGFLYGLTQGRDAAGCGRLGSIAAAEVIGHFGARPASSLAQLVVERNAG